MANQDLQVKGTLDLMEEAVHLIRSAPSGILASYYMGSIPFVLGLLYFWADMSRSSFANEHAGQAALGMSFLFLWMKCWHSVFATRVKAYFGNEPSPRFPLSRILRTAVAQTIVQPSSLFLLPLSFLVFLPFGWVYAFYHNLSLTGNGESDEMRNILQKAWRFAGMWPTQNHKLISVIMILALVVFLNTAVAMLFIPQLIHTLFGVETSFTLSGMHILNTTFLAAAAGFSYLCINPFTKTVYTLRCFYAESIRSGADLSSEFKRLIAEKEQ